MLRLAAQELAKDDQQEKAFKLIRDLITTLSDPAELRATYLCLAEVAKSQSDRELESAALERVLELNPSDPDIRFRIAYLYGEMGNRRLGIYHYNLRLDQGPDAISLNNLGVNYRVLELPGSEITAFEKAGEEDLLPKANLSHAYVDRGFLAKGEEFANEVLRSNTDQIARERATGALNRISTIRSGEKQTIEKIMNEAKTEKVFRSAYANAFVDSMRNPINGEFLTPHGKMSLRQNGDQLIGEGTFEEKQSSGLLGLLPMPGNRQITESIKIRTIKLVAHMAGRSGRYKFETKEMLKDNPWNIPKNETVQGLLIIAEDGRSFEVLEEQDKGVTIYTATKIEP
jgi:hypothetical protein